MAENSNLIAAKEYAKLGWKVFPLSPRTKHPLTAHGFYDATDDPDQINRWWEANPEAGVAIATGLVSGLVVLDVDPRNGGNETLASLEAQYGPLEVSIEAGTGGGGRHLFFAHPGNQMLPGLKGSWAGLDVKSDGGYVVAPFSVHPSGYRYRWADGLTPSNSLKPLPNWIQEALEDKRKMAVAPKQTADEDKSQKIGQGNRDNALTSLAGTMRRRGMSAEAILSALLAENEARCDPPLPENDVKRIAASVMRYAPDEDADPSSAVPPPRAALEKKQRIQFLDIEYIMAHDPPDIDWILPDRLAFGDVCMISGPPGVGKSWVTLEIAVAGATGYPIMGHFSPTKKLTTLIIDEENPPDEVWRRLRKLAKARQISAQELRGKIIVTQPRQGLSFHMKGMGDILIEQAIKPHQPDLIVIDSIIAASNIRNEADAVQVRRFFHDHIYPLQTECNSTILAVHHTSKAVYIRNPQERPDDAGLTRGSIDFMGAVDSALLLKPDRDKKGRFTMDAVKVRRGESPAPLRVEIVDGHYGGAFPLASSTLRTEIASASKANGNGNGGSKKGNGEKKKEAAPEPPSRRRTRQIGLDLAAQVLSESGAKAITRTDLIQKIREKNPELSITACRRAVDELLEDGSLIRGDDVGKTYWLIPLTDPQHPES